MGRNAIRVQSRREPQVKSPRTTQKVKSPGTTRQTTSAEMPGDANRAIKMQIEEIESQCADQHNSEHAVVPLLNAVLGQDGVAHHDKCSTVREGAQKRCVAVHTLGAQMDHGPAMKRRLAPVVEDVLEGAEVEGLDSDEFEGLNAPKLESQEPVTGVSKLLLLLILAL